uniref:Ribosomal protein S2 n=1 Tax=Rhodomonas salina TaxID=3034 RepID=Q9G8V0_RHDSA|nr:ribosomal protein S2 [Rhodomonas salina]AAG17747.1 ribosomal protein S2 [Rhodomonas salina]
MKSKILLNNLFDKKQKKDQFIEHHFVKLSALSFNFKNSSFILGKKNKVFFYKADKLVLFLNEILSFYLNFFKSYPKSLLVVDKRLMFLVSKEASLRSFQGVFFGKYSGGMFNNNIEKYKEYKTLFSKVDMFLFLSIKDPIFSLKELSLLKKPLIVFIEETIKLENYLFYKILFNNNSYFFNYFVLKLLSDCLIKIHMYNYVESKIVH